jgi:hypothetical protein
MSSGNSDGRVPVFQTGCRGFETHPLHLESEKEHDVRMYCGQCDKTKPTVPAHWTAWPSMTVTVDGAVVRRQDAISGEWSHGWRVRDEAPAAPLREVKLPRRG